MASLICAVIAPAPLWAKAATDERNYDIPAQDLEAALIQFGRQSGIDILYGPPVLSTLRSQRVKGAFMPPLALATMMQGTGLTYRFTSATAVVIVKKGASHTTGAGEAAGASGTPQLSLDRLRVTTGRMLGTSRRIDYRPFGRIVQGAITRRLQDDPRTHGRRFETRLAVQLDAAGVIRQLQVERSTGDSALDREIVRALSGAPMPEAPPAAMPQPIWFEIVAR